MNENISKIIEVSIPEDHNGKRLDQSLAILLPDYSRTQIREWIDQGDVLLNNASCKAKQKVQGGEHAHISANIKEQPSFEAQEIPLDIIFEDESVLIINKPVGLVVHPGAGNSDKTLLNAILHHAPDLQSLPRAGILHRLDKETSGLLAIAKTAAALKSLNKQLKDRDMSREYQALVYGSVISGGTIDEPIGRHPRQRTKMAVIEEGKEARTHYRVSERLGNYTRLKLKLDTGRTHQIRVHLAHIKLPIIGDPTYGSRVQLSKGMSDEAIAALRGFKRQALHAFALGFTHPATGEPVKFEAPLPKDMADLLNHLREHANKEK